MKKNVLEFSSILFPSSKSLPLLSSTSLNEAYLLRNILANENNQTIHPHILTLLSIKYLPSLPLNNSIYLIYDYAHNRDLATHALLYGGTERQFSIEQIQTYLHQLLSAVLFCHDRLVYHCAIELKHLLLTRTGQLKLSNFEYAKHAIWPTMKIDIDHVRQSKRRNQIFSFRSKISCRVSFIVHPSYY